MITVDGQSLSIDDVVAVARQNERVSLSSEAVSRVKASRDVVERLVNKGEIVYGITTGFGKFSSVPISSEQTKMLQVNLIRSHAVGVGRPLPEEIVRAVMLLRINTLAKGMSGVRIELLQALIAMLNTGVHPIIPSQGSVGASGDLAPLAHMTLPLIGEGVAMYQGSRMDGAQAMASAGLKPIVLDAKEGLALINGTPVMTAIGALAVHDAVTVLGTANTAAALTMEALKGAPQAFSIKVQMARPHPGQIETARRLQRLLAGSKQASSVRAYRVQDPYSLRCIPQVHGASWDALRYVDHVISIELNSATDNPLVFCDADEVISAGNFHGQPVAFAMDFLGMAIAEIASISQCRIAQMMASDVEELPLFLTADGGLNSGFMLTQYTAASLVSENKVLAHPASVDSIPTSDNWEDHVSMGTTAARKAGNILENTTYVLAIELLSAAQAVWLQRPCTLGKGTTKAYERVRRHVAHLERDRPMSGDITKMRDLILAREFIDSLFLDEQRMVADEP